MVDMKGRWVLITGASRGVGRLIAEFMAEQGANLMLHARKLENLEEVSQAVRAKGAEIMELEAELSDEKQVTAMLDAIVESGHPVDVVFNNAGMQVAYRTAIWDTPFEDWDLSFRIQCAAPALICHRLVPLMLERGFGRVINTTSGIRNEPEQAAYSASKAALNKFTCDLGSYVDKQGKDVIMSLTDPGWIRTDLGGPHAPGDPKSCLPGIVVGAFIEQGASGRNLYAQAFEGLTLEEAVAKADTFPPNSTP